MSADVLKFPGHPPLDGATARVRRAIEDLLTTHRPFLVVARVGGETEIPDYARTDEGTIEDPDGHPQVIRTVTLRFEENAVASPRATREGVEQLLGFQGRSYYCRVPWNQILGILVKEEPREET